MLHNDYLFGRTMEDMPMARIDRKSSIDTEPRTLGMDEFRNAREEAKYVMNTKNLDEAMRIFTEGLQPVVSSVQQNGDEMLLDSVDDVGYFEDYIAQGPRKIVTAPF